MPLNFDKYAQEGNKFLKSLSEDLGYSHDKDYTAFVLRSVLHAIRDRITISESLNLLAQLPMFLKAVYADGWKYKEKPDKANTMGEFIEKVNEHQKKYYDSDFYKYVIDERMIGTVIYSLTAYISEGELENIFSQLPKELKPIISYSISKSF